MPDISRKVAELEMVHLTAADRQRWNAFVARQPDFGLLQSYEWGEFKKRLGWQVYRVAIQKQGQIVAGAQMFIKKLPMGIASVAYIPRGPFVDWEDQKITAVLCEAIHHKARQQRAIFLRIEPPLLHKPAARNLLQSYGFRHIQYANQPRCSMVVDLPEDMNELLMALPSSTRYNIRYSERKGVTIDVAVTSNLRTFYRLMEATGGRSNFPIRALDYYEKEWHIFSQLGQACLFMARYQDQIIAMQMPFYFGKHAATFHAGSLNKYRELKAGYLIMWQAMCWAREQGCRTFDLWGIPDEVGELITNGKSVPDGRSDGLWGVYYFKQAFRGRVVYYAGAFDYVYSPLSYPLFTSKFFTPERLDRIAVWMDRLKHS